MMREIPINRFYSYEDTFFKQSPSVLQGITFPLKKKSSESGNIHLDEDVKVLGTPRRVMDARDLSYALADALV